MVTNSFYKNLNFSNCLINQHDDFIFSYELKLTLLVDWQFPKPEEIFPGLIGWWFYVAKFSDNFNSLSNLFTNIKTIDYVIMSFSDNSTKVYTDLKFKQTVKKL